tara:strand:- start:16568 stop:17341 length:774 start_codon:yes stop_codon:yes gene_type:complete
MIDIILISCVAIIIGLSLGLLGSGGSILTVPALIYIVGQDEKVAIASSLIIVGFIAFSGALKYQLDNMIDWRAVWQFSLFSMLGSYFSAGFSIYLSGEQQLLLFSIIMLLAAISILRKKAPAAYQAIPLNLSLKLAVISCVVGCISGLVGVGGGFLIVPVLLTLAGMNMSKAVATSLMIISLQSLAGFIKYFSISKQQGLNFDWSVIVIVSVVGAMSSILGQKISTGIPQQKLKSSFALLLLVMGIFLLAKASINLF